jgi:hypothetical protein
MEPVDRLLAIFADPKTSRLASAADGGLYRGRNQGAWNFARRSLVKGR